MKTKITLVVFKDMKILHVTKESIPFKPKDAQLVQEFEIDKIFLNL